MTKIRRKRTNKIKKKKETDPFNAKLSNTHKFIITIIFGILLALFEIGRSEGLKRECEERWDRSLGPAQLGGGGIVRGLLKAGCGAGGDEHHHRHRHRRW